MTVTDAAANAGVVSSGRRCVVFDVDDTLYLERSYVRSGFDAVGRWAQTELGLVGLGERCWQGFLDGVRGRAFDDALIACGVTPTPELIAGLVDCYRNHPPEIELLPDAERCIDALRSAGMLIGVITDGPLASQQAKVRALGGDRWADLVVCTASLGPGFGKPHERAFVTIEEQLGVEGGRCVYVGDNVTKDFSGPRARGWMTIRVRRSGGLHAHLVGDTAVDVEVDDLKAVAALLGADGGG